MAWEKILDDIDKIRRIIDEWQRSGAVHVIEKEVVLDKLRAVYEGVKFADTQGEVLREASSEEVVAQAELDCEPIQEAAPVYDNKVAEAETAAVYEAPVKPKHDRKRLMSLYGDGGVAEAPAVESVENVWRPQESAPEQAVPVVNMPEETVGQVFVPEPVGAEQSAFGGGVGTDVLEAMGLAAVDNTEEQAAAPVTVPVVPPMPTVQQTAAPVAAQPQKAGGETYKKVLGDTLKAGETLADIYARTNHHEDVAEKLKNGSVANIRGAIGINDKFLLIRDLFAGNPATYDKTIGELDSFTDLDDALLYIHDNFSWNPDSDGAKLLVDLLTRKLS